MRNRRSAAVIVSAPAAAASACAARLPGAPLTARAAAITASDMRIGFIAIRILFPKDVLRGFGGVWRGSATGC